MSDFIPDKGWLTLDRSSIEFRDGLNIFFEFANANTKGWFEKGKLKCPCTKCKNKYDELIPIIRRHVILNGWDPSYTKWYCHGELQVQRRIRASLLSIDSSSSTIERTEKDDISGLLHAVTGHHIPLNDVVDDPMDASDDDPLEDPIVDPLEDPIDDPLEDPIDDPLEDPIADNQMNDSVFDPYDETFVKRLEEAEEELWPDCSLTKLSCILRLYQMKCLHQWTDKSFEDLLNFLQIAIPNGKNTIPKSMYEAKTVVRDLGLSYNKIHACRNDCLLYRKEYALLDSCPICKTSRWSDETRQTKRKIPVKVLRHFPLIPRLKRLFLCHQMSEDMMWHHSKRTRDGILRHPADSLQWTRFDEEHKEFAAEPRNIRLGLASDGFNPFSIQSTSHSTWPVILIPYNLPPWLCMKQPNFILSLLISGPRAPGKDIDVFLRPLIDELKILWEDGVKTFDVSRKRYFQMHAALLWTIHDYPGYGDLSGWSTKGTYACAVCQSDTESIRLKHGRKESFMGHRRFLDLSHPFRRDKKKFNNEEEHRIAPKRLSGYEVFNEVNNLLEVSEIKI